MLLLLLLPLLLLLLLLQSPMQNVAALEAPVDVTEALYERPVLLAVVVVLY